jgi:polyisoprenoid-binding protein YceI
MTQTVATIPGYKVGTWDIDTVHSDVSFTVRHMMVSKVRGRFGAFTGTVVTAENPLESSVTAEIDLASIDTNNAQRDEHIRSKDFFEVETFPTMTFRSTSVEADGDDYVLTGELTLKGVTKTVPLKLELNGFSADPFGGYRAGFSASTEISRKAFGVDIEMPMDGGGVVVSDKVSINLEIEAVLQQG